MKTARILSIDTSQQLQQQKVADINNKKEDVALASTTTNHDGRPTHIVALAPALIDPQHDVPKSPLSAPPTQDPGASPPRELLNHMAQIAAHRENYGMVEEILHLPPPPPPLTISFNTLTPKTAGNGPLTNGNYTDELSLKTKHLLTVGNYEAPPDRVYTTTTGTLPTYICPRCDRVEYEFDRESHATAHSSLIVDPFLFLGGERNAGNWDELTKRTKITHILNMAWEVANFFPDKFIYKSFRLSDYGDQNILAVLDEAVEFLELCRMNNGRCLVHCVQGISRSASVVIAYIIASENKSFDEALCHVKKRRPLIKPNDGFAQQLREYEKVWRERKKENITLNEWVIARSRSQA